MYFTQHQFSSRVEFHFQFDFVSDATEDAQTKAEISMARTTPDEVYLEPLNNHPPVAYEI